MAEEQLRLGELQLHPQRLDVWPSDQVNGAYGSRLGPPGTTASTRSASWRSATLGRRSPRSSPPPHAVWYPADPPGTRRRCYLWSLVWSEGPAPAPWAAAPAHRRYRTDAGGRPATASAPCCPTPTSPNYRPRAGKPASAAMGTPCRTAGRTRRSWAAPLRLGRQRGEYCKLRARYAAAASSPLSCSSASTSSLALASNLGDTERWTMARPSSWSTARPSAGW
jgi:hypothetical protein